MDTIRIPVWKDERWKDRRKDTEARLMVTATDELLKDRNKRRVIIYDRP